MVRTTTKSSDVWLEPLSINMIAPYDSSSSVPRRSARRETKIVFTYSRKALPSRYGFDYYLSKRSTLIWTPWRIRVLWRNMESCEITTQGVKDSSTIVMHATIVVCFSHRETRWRTVSPAIVFGAITFIGFGSSHFGIPISSRLNTNYAFFSWTYSLKQCIISSRKAHGISNLLCSWGVLLVSDKSSWWCKMKESLIPG
jgi:hypothetical protein